MSDNGQTATALEVPLGDDQPEDKPFSGMNKEELLRFSDTPFWNNVRLVCFVSHGIM